MDRRTILLTAAAASAAGLALTWRTAQAQQPGKIYRVGVLLNQGLTVNGQTNLQYAALRKEHDTLIVTMKSDHERAARSLNTDLDSARGLVRARTDDVTRLTAELDDWKTRYAAMESQSRKSLQSANTVALAASLGFKPQKGGRDDLTIVEGIGPKINELLIAGGIDTFVKLANAPVERVQAILDAAGPSFRLAKPATWARQGELCAGGEWEALRALQDALTAGVDTDKKA